MLESRRQENEIQEKPENIRLIFVDPFDEAESKFKCQTINIHHPEREKERKRKRKRSTKTGSNIQFECNWIEGNS